MAGLFDKARLVVLSTAHSLLDKAIDLNSVEAVKQYVRDLEGSLEDLEDSAAQASGYVRTVTREVTQLKTRAAELDHNIDFILGDGDDNNDHLALPMQARLDALNTRVETKQSELQGADQTSQALNEAVSGLRSKHVVMVEKIQELEAMDRAAKAKENAAETLEQVGRMTSASPDVSVDDVASRIQRRADVADVKFEKAMGGMNTEAGKDVALAQAAARLAERKARLAKKSS